MTYSKWVQQHLMINLFPHLETEDDREESKILKQLHHNGIPNRSWHLDNVK